MNAVKSASVGRSRPTMFAAPDRHPLGKLVRYA